MQNSKPTASQRLSLRFEFDFTTFLVGNQARKRAMPINSLFQSFTLFSSLWAPKEKHSGIRLDPSDCRFMHVIFHRNLNLLVNKCRVKALYLSDCSRDHSPFRPSLTKLRRSGSCRGLEARRRWCLADHFRCR